GTSTTVSAMSDRRGCVHEDRLWDLARGALAPDEAARILDHSLECPDCSLALRVANETFKISGLLESPSHSAATAERSSTWAWITGTFLRPAPALVYLVLLVLSFPVYRLLMPPQSGTSATTRANGNTTGERGPGAAHSPGSGAAPTG